MFPSHPITLPTNQIRRNANINQESRQRAKILTNQHQADLRAERIKTTHSEIVYKGHDLITVLQTKIKQNEYCELVLYKAKGETIVTPELIKVAQHEHFSKYKCEELKAFILAKKNLVKSHLPS